ncbi:MAG: sigma-54 dependent transcriptional regulator [Bdellovibrionota bacterium]
MVGYRSSYCFISLVLLVSIILCGLFNAQVAHANLKCTELLAPNGQRYYQVDKFMTADPAAFQGVTRRIMKVASTEATVLIRGETGTGKEFVARAVHALSLRADKPLVVFNVAAIPENLLESTLFGHLKGSFTGAITNQRGFFESADKGTLFIDEIGELPLTAQAKLLRVLDQREITPVGAVESKPIDVRIIAATHRDLQAMVQKGTFREDLYYRLFAYEILIPPLRDRPSDVRLFLDKFFEEFKSQHQVDHVIGFTESSYVAADAYEWRGNLRELRHRVERAIIDARGERDQDRIDLSLYLPEKSSAADLRLSSVAKPVPEVKSDLQIKAEAQRSPPAPTLIGDKNSAERIRGIAKLLTSFVGNALEEGLAIRLTAKELVDFAMIFTVKRYGENRTEAAKKLGIHRRTLFKAMQETGLQKDEANGRLDIPGMSNDPLYRKFEIAFGDIGNASLPSLEEWKKAVPFVSGL